jgi:hypothetical protein
MSTATTCTIEYDAAPAKAVTTEDFLAALYPPGTPGDATEYRLVAVATIPQGVAAKGEEGGRG